MADPVTAALAWVGAEVGGEIGATLIIYSTEIATAITAVTAAYTLRDQQRKAQNRARDAYNASLRDRYVMVRGATEPRQFVLGRQRVSGPIGFIRSTGNDRTTLAFVVLLAAHEIDAVEQIYIDDELATLDVGGNVIAVQRRDQYSIAASTATVELASEPKAGTVTAVATYGTSSVPLTITGVSGTSVSVSGASSSATGTLTITYQPATNPWVGSTVGTDPQSILVLDSFGNGSVVLAETPVAGTVHAVASTGTGQDRTDTDLASYLSISGTTATITGAPTVGQTVAITYRAADRTTSIWTDLGAAMGTTTARMNITVHTGAPGQTADAGLISLFPGVWTSSHVLTGQAYLMVRCAFDPDAFPSGLPNISAVVRGAKLYDPRDGATRWSENPALMCRYVATHPLLGRQPASAMNDANIAAQSNVCDTSTTYVVDGQSYVRPLYTAGHTIKAGTRPADVLNDLCSAMAGKWCVVDGMLRLRAGAAVTALQELDETWLAGTIDDQPTSIEIQAQVARADVFNTATGKFADASRDFQELDYPAVGGDGTPYVIADGAVLPQEIMLPAVTFAGQAQQVVATMMRDARMGMRVTLTCNMRAFAVEPFDVLRVTLPRFGWAAKLFEVLDVQWAVGGGIQLALKETDPAIWALGTSFSATPLAPPTLLPSPWYVPAVAGLACYSGAGEFQTQADGTVVGTMRVAWTAITDRYVLESGGGIEVKYGPATEPESAWRTARAIDGAGSIRLADVQDGRIYLIKARAFTAMTKGAWSATVLHMVASKTTGPAAAASITATAQPGGVLVSWTPCTESDYLESEVRYGTSWAAGTRIYKGRAIGTVWPWPSAGTYTLRVKHRNNSGLDSAETTTSITVGTNTLIDWSLVAGTGKPADGATVNRLTYAASAPGSPIDGDIWVDTSGSPAVVKLRISGAWQASANLSTGALAQLNVVDTAQIASGAATDVYLDTYDFSDTAMGGGQRSFTYTPTQNCTIEFTAKATAAQVYPDGGHFLRWYVNAGSGDVLLGSGVTTSSAKQDFACVASFAATSGVTLTFKLTAVVPFGDPNITVGVTTMRVTAIKR